MTNGMVIVGGGMAGARAIVNLRASGYEGAITLVGEETLLPYCLLYTSDAADE